MRDPARQLDLAFEALGRVADPSQLGPYGLEGHPLVQLEVFGLVDLAHAAARQERDHPVAPAHLIARLHQRRTARSRLSAGYERHRQRGRAPGPVAPIVGLAHSVGLYPQPVIRAGVATAPRPALARSWPDAASDRPSVAAPPRATCRWGRSTGRTCRALQ